MYEKILKEINDKRNIKFKNLDPDSQKETPLNFVVKNNASLRISIPKPKLTYLLENSDLNYEDSLTKHSTLSLCLIGNAGQGLYLKNKNWECLFEKTDFTDKEKNSKILACFLSSYWLQKLEQIPKHLIDKLFSLEFTNIFSVLTNDDDVKKRLVYLTSNIFSKGSDDFVKEKVLEYIFKDNEFLEYIKLKGDEVNNIELKFGQYIKALESKKKLAVLPSSTSKKKVSI